MKDFINIIIKLIYLGIIFDIAKKDIKNKKIDKEHIVLVSIISIIYMIYQVFLDRSFLYINMIYLIIYIIILAIDTFILIQYAKESYVMSLLIIINATLIFSGINIFIKTIMVAITAIIIYLIIRKITKRKNIQGEKETLSIGFYICTSNILTILVELIVKII